uniref:Uncharacterized protein n=1 Tax=Leersia perrieri TaxID=77586 RepID=A0A0D9X118_9ORYZ
MFRAIQLVIRHLSTASSCQRLPGKVAVITGAASGIGKATVAEFIRNGAKVILADIQDDLGRAISLASDEAKFVTGRTASSTAVSPSGSRWICGCHVDEQEMLPTIFF